MQLGSTESRVAAVVRTFPVDFMQGREKGKRKIHTSAKQTNRMKTSVKIGSEEKKKGCITSDSVESIRFI